MDDSETVASQGEIVRSLTCTTLSQVVGGLAVDCEDCSQYDGSQLRGERGVRGLTRGTGVSVRDRHLRQSHAVEQWTTVVADIPQNDALSDVKVHSELPLLPFNRLSVLSNGERDSLRLTGAERCVSWAPVTASMEVLTRCESA